LFKITGSSLKYYTNSLQHELQISLVHHHLLAKTHIKTAAAPIKKIMTETVAANMIRPFLLSLVVDEELLCVVLGKSKVFGRLFVVVVGGVGGEGIEVYVVPGPRWRGNNKFRKFDRGSAIGRLMADITQRSWHKPSTSSSDRPVFRRVKGAAKTSEKNTKGTAQYIINRMSQRLSVEFMEVYNGFSYTSSIR
jgi:hypothetical protein